MDMFVTSSADKVSVYNAQLPEKCRLFLIGDYHCTVDDDRGIPFRQYSARMAQYEKLSMEQLESEFCRAKQENADCGVDRT